MEGRPGPPLRRRWPERDHWDVPFDVKVVSPAFGPPDGARAGFNGDYRGLTIPKGS